MDAIPQTSHDTESRYHGFLIPEENVANIKHGAQVLRGQLCPAPHAILTERSEGTQTCYAEHLVGDVGGIVIKLGQQCVLNHFRMLLWDNDESVGNCYSYYIEVSRDQSEWARVWDHTQYHCRSWQKIFFPVMVIRYIRIVGTGCTREEPFRVKCLQAYFTREECHLDPHTSLIVPSKSILQNAKFIEGDTSSVNPMQAKETGVYISSGKFSHKIDGGAIIVQLPQPFLISSIRFMLLEKGTFSYYVELSPDFCTWKNVWDKSKETCKSWQMVEFSPTPVVYIKIVGTRAPQGESYF